MLGKMDLQFTLNGKRAHAALGDPTDTLLGWLRARGLTGTKEGCAEGECGACAVALLTTDDAGNAHYQAVNSCLLPLGAVAGRSVVSVEGVADADGTLHPVQAALVAHGGSQCGYCTPGFVMSMFAEYYRPERDGFDLEAIAGNLCRCTGYRPIIDAARSLTTPHADDPHLPTAALLRHKPPAAEQRERGFFRPPTLDALFALRAEHPAAPLLAGGTDLMIGVTQHGIHHDALISLDAITALSALQCTSDELTIGAGMTLTSLAEQLAARPGTAPLLQQLFPLFSSKLIRNRATLGGNLQTASPIGDAAPCLLALQADLTLMGPRGARRVPLSSFFLDYRKTTLAPDELITAIHVPLPSPRFTRFYKVSKRILDDIAIVSAAFALRVHDDGRIAQLDLAYGGVAATPLALPEVAALAVDQPFNDATCERLCGALAQVATPLSDHRGSAAYRRVLMPRLFEKFWVEITAEAGA
jgi:xanthine dehydrogenase small subunit